MTKIKITINYPKITKEKLSGLTQLNQRTSPMKLVNISLNQFSQLKDIFFAATINVIAYLIKVMWTWAIVAW